MGGTYLNDVNNRAKILCAIFKKIRKAGQQIDQNFAWLRGVVQYGQPQLKTILERRDFDQSFERNKRGNFLDIFLK